MKEETLIVKISDKDRLCAIAGPMEVSVLEIGGLHYSPVQSKPMPPSSPPLYNITEEEITLFTQRYEEGYCIIPMMKDTTTGLN